MANQSNTNIMERAQSVLEELTGTIWERIIERDIDANDLESLKYHVTLAEAELSIEDDYPVELGDDSAS